MSHPANETRPMYSPDGTRLAFVSNRTGNGDLYVLNLGTGALQRITFDDAAEQLDGWSRDGKYLYFSSSAQEVAGMNDIFRISAEGGMPVAVTRRPRTSTSSSPRLRPTANRSPSRHAATRRASGGGTATATWTNPRSGWRPSAGAEIRKAGRRRFQMPVADVERRRRARLLHERSGRRGEPLGEEPSSGGAPKQVTQFHDGRVLWPSISYDGKTIVFERNFGIWKLDTATGKAAPIEITRRGATGTPEVNHLSLTNQFRDLVLAPDGRKLAFTAHGEVFAAGGPRGRAGSARHAHHGQRESDRLVAGQPPRWCMCRIATAPIISTFTISPTAPRPASPAMPAPKPLPCGAPTESCSAFVRDGKQLCVYDVAAKQVRTLASGHFPRPPFGSNRFYAWSPDNNGLPTSLRATRSFRKYLRGAGGGRHAAPDQLSSPIPTAARVLWAPDGTYILFDTNQRTENNNIARIDLVLKTPRFREDRFRDLFRDTPRRAQHAARRMPRAPAPPSPWRSSSKESATA